MLNAVGLVELPAFFIVPAAMLMAAVLRRTLWHLNTGQLVVERSDWWDRELPFSKPT